MERKYGGAGEKGNGGREGSFEIERGRAIGKEMAGVVTEALECFLCQCEEV